MSDDELLPPMMFNDGTPLPGMSGYRGKKSTYLKAQDLLNDANSTLDSLPNSDSGTVEDNIEIEPVERTMTDVDIQVEAAKAFNKIQMPAIKGLTAEYWQALVNNACAMDRLNEKITIDNLKKACPEIPLDVIQGVMASGAFFRILEYRGVVQDNSSVGMTERQFMALNVLTNYTDTRKMATKLKSIGVSHSEFQQWLSGNSRFRRIYRQLSEQMFDEAQASVNVALTSGAVDGDIRFIKYFNEMSGRFDPAARQSMDVQQVLGAITEIITSVVRDPDQLREIGGRMAMLMGGSGINGALNSTVQNKPELESNTSSFFFN